MAKTIPTKTSPTRSTAKHRTLVPTNYLMKIARTDGTTMLRLMKDLRIKPERTLTTGQRTYRYWGELAVAAATEWRKQMDARAEKAAQADTVAEETVIETFAQPASEEQRFKALADALGQALTDFTVARNDLVTLRTEQTEIRRLLANILEVVTRPAPAPALPTQLMRFGGVEWPTVAAGIVPATSLKTTFSNGQLEAVAGNVDG